MTRGVLLTHLVRENDHYNLHKSIMTYFNECEKRLKQACQFYYNKDMPSGSEIMTLNSSSNRRKNIVNVAAYSDGSSSSCDSVRKETKPPSEIIVEEPSSIPKKKRK